MGHSESRRFVGLLLARARWLRARVGEIERTAAIGAIARGARNGRAIAEGRRSGIVDRPMIEDRGRGTDDAGVKTVVVLPGLRLGMIRAGGMRVRGNRNVIAGDYDAIGLGEERDQDDRG